MAVEKNLQLVKDKKMEFSDYYKRMDADRKIYLLDPYIMKQLDGQQTPDVINVTMNEAMVFATRAAAIMNGANMQPEVFGKGLSDKETTTFEEFLHDIYLATDEILANSMLCSLYGFSIEQINIRGAIAARCLMREDGKDGRFIPDISPIDTRYLTYEHDSKGLVWGAPTITRTRAQIERDYGIKVRTKKADVIDFWDAEVNDIYIADQQFKGKEGGETYPLKHGLGYPPLVIRKSGSGSMLQDAGNLKYSGESIFASNRGLLPELHRAASIMQTLTAMSFEGSYQYESEEGTAAEKPASPVQGMRKTFPIDKGTKGYFPILINDVRNATRLFYSMLVGALQRGSLPNIDYGNLTFPLSAVAISRLTASKDAIFVPRLQAMAMFYRALSKMIVKQYVKGGYKQVEIGEEGIEREYSASDIDKKFGINYHFYSVSPEQEIANTAIAQQQLALGLSRETVYRDTLKLKDVAGEIMKSRAERGEKGDLAISLYELVHSYIDVNTDRSNIKAEMTLQQLETVLRQRAMGQPSGLAPVKGGAGVEQIKSMIPLMAGGGGGRQAQTPGTEEALEPEEAEVRAERRDEIVRKNVEES